MRPHCCRNSSGESLFVIQPSAYRATRRKERSITASEADAPPFQVRPVGFDAIHIGHGCCTGGGSRVTRSDEENPPRRGALFFPKSIRATTTPSSRRPPRRAAR